MEGKKRPGSPCPPRPTSSLVADLFGEKRTPSSSSSSLFNSVFPPASSVMGKDKSQPDILSPLKKYEVGPDGKSHGGASKGGRVVNNNKNGIYQNEKADPCLFGSSLYYGDRDMCSHTSSSPDTRYNYKKDGEDDPNNSNASLRGDWWQGSLYY